MSIPSDTFTELVVTTHRKHKKGFKDNFTNRNAFLSAMNKRGNSRHESGGLTIVEPLEYDNNSTYQRYSDYDRLNIQQSNVFTAAEYPWKQIAMHVTSSGRELLINSGDSVIEKLVASKIKNAYRSYRNNFSSDLWSAGSLANQIGGVQHFIADTNTNTVGGISANDWSFWRNTVFDLSSNSVTIGANTIENSVLLPLWMDLDRGGDDCPDLIVMSPTWYQYFHQSQAALKRYASAESVKAGIGALKFQFADVIWDTTASGIPDNHIYMINTSYVKLVSHEKADFDEMAKKTPIDQHAELVMFVWMGNVTCSNRAQQGVVIE